HDLSSPCKSRHHSEAVTESGCHTSTMSRASSKTTSRSPSPPTSVTVTSKPFQSQPGGISRNGPAVLGTKKPRYSFARATGSCNRSKWATTAPQPETKPEAVNGIYGYGKSRDRSP